MVELREEVKNPEIALTGDNEFTTLDDCVNYWLEPTVVHLKKGTQELYKSFAKNYYLNVFPDKDVEKISPREWMEWFDKISEHNRKFANSAFSKLRSCLNFCKSKFIINGTKLEMLRQQDVGIPSEKGSRVLRWHELAKIWIAIERSQASTANKSLHQLTMLIGNRLSELRLAKRSHFDLETGIWTVPKEISKMGNEIRRPIPPVAKPIIERLMMA
ncbi:integrase [Veronia nyctiphanis]|uniref:Integrase n=1 Tax=Veronia nyctiphanis TaxID=1278244 RepID=A0A4Q0YU00_9GAMM|nr:site-specific integrase [Veronia nyctiphanis]RXJ74223.1 integrase [Veronia nyctiphanis]